MIDMDSTLTAVTFAVALLAVGLLLSATAGQASHRRRTTAQLAAIDRKLQVVLDSLGLTDPASELPVVLQHVDRGEKIQAIKAYREATGVGLQEAKDAVEAIMHGRRR